MSIDFTNREMQGAWKANMQASIYASRSNSHRLLLFYAVECGLKAVLMKRESADCTNRCKEIIDAQHNINRLLDVLCAGEGLKLPDKLTMREINDKGNKRQRLLSCGQINQAWRYGGKVISKIDKEETISDSDLENQLVKINKWIERELGKV